MDRRNFLSAQKIRPFFGRLDSAAPRCPAEDLRDIDHDLEMIDDHLAANNLRRRIPRPAGLDTDRDRICTQLLLAMKDLRAIDAAVGRAGRSPGPQWHVQRARARDQRIVDLLYRLSVPILLVFCRARIRRSDYGFDANDLMEDVFLNLWLKCDRFQERNGASFTAWVLVIAENYILGLTRRYRRERERVRLIAETSSRVVATRDPVRDVATAESIGCFRREYTFLMLLCAAAIDRLPPRGLELLALRDREELSYGAIAARLAISRDHVGMWIRRARKRVLDEVTRALKRAFPSEEGRER